jgi:small-conductance mechanosensitive channel
MLNEAIWFNLKDVGITIAFPQLNLHVDPATSRTALEIDGPFARVS